MKTHVGILACTFPPSKDGVSYAASTMALGLMQAGFRVSIFTEKTAPPRTSNEWKGCSVFEFSIYGSASLGRGFKGDVSLFLQVLSAANCDCLIFHSWPYWPVDIAYPYFPKLKAKKILVSHGFGAHLVPWRKSFPFGLGYWARWLPYIFNLPNRLRAFDAVVFLSKVKNFDTFFDHLVASIFASSRCHVVPNGVDLNESIAERQSFRKQHEISGNSFTFICVANYSDRKNQKYAVQAFRLANIPNSTLIMIGSEFNACSDHFQRLDEPLASVRSSQKVLWFEKLNRNTTLAAISTADCAVLSSKNEAQPIFLLEAMRAQKPWIARNTGCIKEMPGGVCISSINQMASEMKRMARKDARYHELGAKGKEASQTIYNINSYMNSYVDIVNKICKSKD